MRILLTAVLVTVSVFSTKAQTELSGQVVTKPNNTWTPAYVYYDLTAVATDLGYTDAAALAAALDAQEIGVMNVSKVGTESVNYTANNGQYGSFWLDATGEVVTYESGNNVIWSQLSWNTGNGQLIIGLGQNAWLNGSTGCAPGIYTAKTKLTHDSKSVTLVSTLNISQTLTATAFGSTAAWNTKDVTYPMSTVATCLGFEDASALKTALDAQTVAIKAKKADGTWAASYTSNYTRGGETYSYGCYFFDENEYVVDGWQYWSWSWEPAGWNQKYGVIANHFDFDDSNITIHLLQGNDGCPVGINTVEVTLWTDQGSVALRSNLAIQATHVSDLDIVDEGTVYIQETPWTGWSSAKGFSFDATALLTETGVSSSLISDNLSSLIFSYASPTDADALNNDASTNTTTGIGFWLKEATTPPTAITVWADTPEFYIDNLYFTNGILGGVIGQNPNIMQAGNHRTADLYLIYGTKAVKLTVVLDVADAIISETETFTNADATGMVVALNRTIKAGLNTLVLPFSMTQAEVETYFGEDSKVYVVNKFANGNISFTTSDGISANTPCLLKATKAIAATEPIVLTGRDLVSGTPTTTVDGLQFVGTYAPIEKVPAGSFIISGGKIYEVNSDVSLKGTRAYFTVPASSAKALTFSFDDSEATGIEAMGNEQLTMNNGEVYDLSGRAVKTPTKGLYIINGKKVFVK